MVIRNRREHDKYLADKWCAIALRMGATKAQVSEGDQLSIEFEDSEVEEKFFTLLNTVHPWLVIGNPWLENSDG